MDKDKNLIYTCIICGLKSDVKITDSDLSLCYTCLDTAVKDTNKFVIKDNCVYINTTCTNSTITN